MIVGASGLSAIADRDLLRLHSDGMVETIGDEELRRAIALRTDGPRYLAPPPALEPRAAAATVRWLSTGVESAQDQGRYERSNPRH